MAVEIQEPNDLPGGTITPDTENNIEILVYQRAADAAGIKKMGVAPWKNYLGFNSHKVNNVASYIGMPTDYAWETDADIPYTGTKLSDQVKTLSDKLGIDTEPGTFTPTLLSRVTTSQDDINTLQTQVAATNTGLLDRVSAIEDEISGGGSGPTPSINTRLNTLEGRVGNPTEGTTAATGLMKVQEEVEDSTNGLLTRMQTAEGNITSLQTTVGDASSGLVKDVTDLKTTVGDDNSGLVKKVNDLESKVYRFSGSIVSVNDENATTELNLSGGTSILVSALENGMVFDINPPQGTDTIKMTINGGQQQTFSKGTNIAWTEPASGPAFFDELGFNIDITELNKIKETVDEIKYNTFEVASGNTWDSSLLDISDGLYQFSLTIKQGPVYKTSVLIAPIVGKDPAVVSDADIVDVSNNFSTYWELTSGHLTTKINNTIRKITYTKIGEL